MKIILSAILLGSVPIVYDFSILPLYLILVHSPTSIGALSGNSDTDAENIPVLL